MNLREIQPLVSAAIQHFPAGSEFKSGPRGSATLAEQWEVAQRLALITSLSVHMDRLRYIYKGGFSSACCCDALRFLDFDFPSFLFLFYLFSAKPFGVSFSVE
jgi:hypothetical protein